MIVDKVGNMIMNPLLGTLIIFSAILLLFFGLPFAGLVIMNKISPAHLMLTGPDTPVKPIATSQRAQIPITIQKAYHKGNLIWVDA